MVSSGISHFISQLKASSRFRDQVVYHRSLPGSDGIYASPSRAWPRKISSLLQDLGIRKLYSHQALALDSVREQEHTVIATPTASGKTLTYLLPVLESFLEGNGSRTLYISPLKALARDQLKALKQIVSLLDPNCRPSASVYDGDTPQRERTRIRNQMPDILLTNPEMLHLAILPHHHNWSNFLAQLDYVVIDEVHTYRGITGSNMAWVFRRLQRICAYYGSAPTFIFCSATVGNPEELAENLTGLRVSRVQENGAPYGPKHFLFLNPVLEGAATSALQLLHAALIRGLRTIVYCQSRKMTELISMWTQQRLANYAPFITAYRAGFLPEERRKIEAKLAEGELLGVISTSALELGIDIGELDLCLLVGYPGSVMATWQRGGRVGRKQQESAVLLLGQEDSLDQYFMHNPEEFFRMEPEKAVINHLNPVLARSHLQCAAADLALHREEPLVTEPDLQGHLEQMESEGLLISSAENFLYYPRNPDVAHSVPLRGGQRQLQIVDTGKGKVIGDVDSHRACRETHPGAVYLHQGRTYVIRDIDFDQATVWAQQKKVNYFTRVRTEKETRILEVNRHRNLGDVTVCLGRLRVTERFTGYEKRLVRGQRLISVIPLDLPPLVFETEGLWIQLPRRIQNRVERDKHHFMGGIHALEHLLIGIMPLLILTDRNDLGGISHPLHPQLESSAVFVFDAHPGGMGLSAQAFSQPERLLDKAKQASSACGCPHGCPFCIQSPKCGSGNRPLDKRALHTILQAMREGEGTPAQPPYIIEDNSPEKEEEPDQKREKRETRYGVLDLETRLTPQEVGGWHNAHLMGLSCAVLYDSTSGEYSAYWESQVEDLLAALHSLDLVVGFNLLGFDYRVLNAYNSADLTRIPTLDILREIHTRLGHRLSLKQLARATLGVSPQDNSSEAPQWFKRGETERLLRYCREDVHLTHALYLFGKQEGYLMYTNKAGKPVTLPVEWL